MIAFLVLSLFSISTHISANIHTELAAQQPQASVSVSLVFDKKNIDAHPELKQNFIEFASSHLQTQDRAMVASIAYLAHIYPEECKQWVTNKDGVKIPDDVEKILQNYEAEKNKTPLQNIANILTWQNIFLYGIYPISRPFCFFKSFDEEGNEFAPVSFLGCIVPYMDKDEVDRVEFCWPVIPIEEWPKVIIGTAISGAIAHKIKEHTTECWGWKMQEPEDKKGFNVERVGAAMLRFFMWSQVENLIANKVVFPVLSLAETK